MDTPDNILVPHEFAKAGTSSRRDEPGPSSVPPWRLFAVLAFVAIALTVVVFHFTATLAPLTADSAGTFLHHPHDGTEGHGYLRSEWRPRVLSLGAAEMVSHAVGWMSGPQADVLAITAGAHAALWFLLTNLLLVLAFKQRSLVLMLGIFAATMFGYTPGIADRIYPWDMPTVFFFTAFVVCVEHAKYRWIPAIILVGLLFKESTVVLTAAFLFFKLPWPTRLAGFGATTLLAIAIKSAVDLAVGNGIPVLSVSMVEAGSQQLRIVANFNELFALQLAHPLFANAGTVVVLFLLPSRNSEALPMMKVIGAIFIAALMMFGDVQDPRSWFELAPLAVYGLLITMTASRHPSPQQGVSP